MHFFFLFLFMTSCHCGHAILVPPKSQVNVTSKPAAKKHKRDKYDNNPNTDKDRDYNTHGQIHPTKIRVLRSKPKHPPSDYVEFSKTDENYLRHQEECKAALHETQG